MSKAEDGEHLIDLPEGAKLLVRWHHTPAREVEGLKIKEACVVAILIKEPGPWKPEPADNRKADFIMWNLEKKGLIMAKGVLHDGLTNKSPSSDLPKPKGGSVNEGATRSGPASTPPTLGPRCA